MTDVLRIDKWLWFARICKTRTLAQSLVQRGAIFVNDQKIDKPNRNVRIGDRLRIDLGPVERAVTIVALPVRRGPAPEAAATYDEPNPPRRTRDPRVPPPLQRIPGSGRPTKRERRALEAFFIRSRED